MLSKEAGYSVKPMDNGGHWRGRAGGRPQVFRPICAGSAPNHHPHFGNQPRADVLIYINKIKISISRNSSYENRGAGVMTLARLLCILRHPQRVIVNGKRGLLEETNPTRFHALRSA